MGSAWLPKKWVSPCVINTRPPYYWPQMCHAKAFAPLPQDLGGCFCSRPDTSIIIRLRSMGDSVHPRTSGGELEAGMSHGCGKRCLRKPTLSRLPRNILTGPIKPTFGSNYNMPTFEHFCSFPMETVTQGFWGRGFDSDVLWVSKSGRQLDFVVKWVVIPAVLRSRYHTAVSRAY